MSRFVPMLFTLAQFLCRQKTEPNSCYITNLVESTKTIVHFIRDFDIRFRLPSNLTDHGTTTVGSFELMAKVFVFFKFDFNSKVLRF